MRSFGTVAILTLAFGVTTGTAVGLTYSAHFKSANPAAKSGYEETVTKTGLVVITETAEGTTHRLTDVGRRFLREYRFLEKLEE